MDGSTVILGIEIPSTDPVFVGIIAMAAGDHPETIPEPSATTDSSKEWPRVTAVPSTSPVHTLQRHHPKKRHPNRHRAEERT
jgi:hypothetical protein